MTLNSHDLANSGGFGAAQQVLKRHGQWDEYAGLPVRKYRLLVTYLVEDSKVMTVQARSEEEAQDIAQSDLEAWFGADVDMTDVEILESIGGEPDGPTACGTLIEGETPCAAST